LTALRAEADVVLVDCLNLWVANLLEKRPTPSDRDLESEAAELAAVMVRPRYSLILVSNEVGWGVHPETPLGRRFRDALGLVNQAAARAASEVVLLVAGCPVVVKPAPPGPNP
jgi:adenosylcobinamide kinase/adenosylcobinamide-phosphate guanylyltransferase